MMRLTDANAVLPTKFEMKYPSTTLYMDVTIIMVMDGRVKRISLP